MINWQQIETVMLDMDGTLLDLHFDNYFWLHHLPKRYAEIHQQDTATVDEQLKIQIEKVKGTLDWYCLDYWSTELQLDIVALKEEITHMISIRPYVLELLKNLKDSHKHIMLVTNAHRKSYNLKMTHTGIHSLFDEVVVSHDFNAAKEEPGFWQRLQDKHHFDPHSTLLVDDTSSVLRSAQKFGIKHLLTLLQPDSKQAVRDQTEFPGILHFDEIFPILKAS